MRHARPDPRAGLGGARLDEMIAALEEDAVEGPGPPPIGA